MSDDYAALLRTALADLGAGPGIFADWLEERGDARGVLLRRRWKRWRAERDSESRFRDKTTTDTYACMWRLREILGVGAVGMSWWYRHVKAHNLDIAAVPIRGFQIRTRHLREAYRELVDRKLRRYIRCRLAATRGAAAGEG